MSYKYSKGSQVIGDLKAADDTQRDTVIDFGEDQIEFQTSGSTRMAVGNDGIQVTGLNINGEYTFPTSDGSANQVLQTNGSGQLTFASVSGGGGGAGSSNRSIYRGYVNLQTTPRVVSMDLSANLGPTANNNYKGFIIVPFNGTLDTIIVSTKGVSINSSNTGDVTVYAYKNQDNFASSTDVTVAHGNFSQKASGTPNVYSGIFDFSLSVSQGDLIQLKVGKASGSNTESLVTIVFTES